ncbi:hypothetical protein ANRL1_04099 [Anaerolineae bacterium]|nr:hypothetical protein ANRL1_04099 [Anaerolineae bacterium]
MKAITLTQPWATLVAIGAKRIETRSWSTAYRGPLAIHAAKTFPKDARDLCRDLYPGAALFSSVLIAAGYDRIAQIPLGVVVATCELVAVKRIIPGYIKVLRDQMGHFNSEQEIAFGDYTPGRYAWILADVRSLDAPIPAKGALGLWEWSER